MKKILAVYDVEGWCWYTQALGLVMYAPKEYQLTICGPENFQTKNPGWLRQFDGILNFSWPESPFPYGVNRYCTVLAHCGCMYEPGSDWLDWRRVAATNIRNENTARKNLPRFDAILAVSKELERHAKNYCQNVYYCPAGVDEQVYVPANRPERKEGDPIVVGWCGQSPEGIRTTKGYHEILKPIMDANQRLGGTAVEFKVNTHTAHDGALSQKEMVKWYQSIDVFLCTSISEGGPATVFEAAACGVPSISTPVGDVVDFIRCGPATKGKATNGWLIPGYHDQESAEKTIDAFSGILMNLDHDEIALRGLAARQDILCERTWKIVAPRWCRAICGELDE